MAEGEPKRVLILGAGHVSRPIVRYFLGQDDCVLTAASLEARDAEALVGGHPRGRARGVDVTDPGQLAALIREADLVISLVPYTYHAQVARLSIEHRVPMVTTSYVQPAMRALDGEARRAGVTILNEIGLDPGIDHMSAMRMIDRSHDAGERVTSFVSCCGGLPAPEAADNPWKYKFSWSPRGALLAGRLPARHLEQGKVIDVPGEELFAHGRPLAVEDLGGFEIYPNRDSLSYIDAYGLQDAHTMLRATIRYPGWCETMRVVARLGLLDVEPRDWPAGATYADFLRSFLPPGPGAVELRLAREAGVAEGHPIVERFRWAGLFSDDALPHSPAAPLDVLAERLAGRMVYAKGERDMVILRHELIARREGRKDERHTSLLVAYGEPGCDSAMARTVSLPAALAGRRMLDRQMHEPGVQIPTRREVYEPVLAALETAGLSFREWTSPA